MKLALTHGCALLALLIATPIAAQTKVSPAIKTALADSGRPEKDVARDATRHPGEILTFAGIKPGMKVADFMMGSGYFTRILAKTVGPKGHVYGYQAGQFIKGRPAYADEQKTAVTGYANVTPLSMNLEEVAFAEPLDAIITVQNYHDLYLKFGGPEFAQGVTKRLYDSLKPGGVLLVIDHVANTDPEFKAPATIHRIDPAAARTAIEKAGFKYAGSSKLLVDATDPHTANVFDPSIRGKTDQFIFLFKKPK